VAQYAVVVVVEEEEEEEESLFRDGEMEAFPKPAPP